MTRRIDVSLISANNVTNNYVVAASGGFATFTHITSLISAGNNINIDGNGVISSTAGGTVTQANLTTSNVVELTNLYYTNNRVRANVVSLLPNYGGNILVDIIEATTWNGIYSGNVTESDQNLYFSNIRARNAFGASTGVIYDVNTGNFAIGQNVATTANVTFNNLTVTGTTTYYGNITTYNANNLVIGESMIYLNDGDDTSNPDIGIAANYNDGTYKHTGFFRDATDGNWKVYDSYTPEPSANIFIDTSHASFRLANIQANVFVGDLKGNVVGAITGTVTSISNFSTTDLSEGNNLYYTNSRVRSNVIALLPTLAGSGISITAEGIISSTGGGGGGGGGPAALTLDSFTGNGTQTNFSLSTAPSSENYTFVVIDGVSQLKTAYSISGSTLILSGAPVDGAKIEVTTITALSADQPNLITRSYVGTGSQTDYTVTSGVLSTGLLVTENGILQTPETDYTVSGTTLTFTTAPASNIAIQVRELTTVVANTSGGGASDARAIGYSLVFGG